MTSIELDQLTKVYGAGRKAVTAVDAASLTIPPGEFFFLLGPSGCGKTTLLRMIAGLIPPTRGRVLFGEEDVTRRPVEDRRTAMVFQNYALWPHMTVRKNVEFGPKMRRRPAAERRKVAAESLRRVEMEDYEARKPNQLSGGQQQRVALARALAAGANCLLFDEPLSNLDARLRMQMRGELRTLVKTTGATALYVTHDQKEALSMADRVAVMHDGRIVQVDAPMDLYDRPATRFVADFLGEANFLSGRVTDRTRPARVETDDGVVESEADAPADGEVTACVRPERVRIETNGEGPAANSISARVENRIFLGEMVQYTCTLGSGRLWKVSALSGGRAVAPGTDVRLHFRPADVCLLTE